MVKVRFSASQATLVCFDLGSRRNIPPICGNRMTSLMFFVGSEFICNSLVLLSKHIVIHLEVNFLRCNADSDFDWHLRAQIAPITFHLNLNSSRSLSNIALLHLIIPWFLGYTWYHFSKQYIIISGLCKWLYHFSIWFSFLPYDADAPDSNWCDLLIPSYMCKSDRKHKYWHLPSVLHTFNCHSSTFFLFHHDPNVASFFVQPSICHAL